MDSILLLIALLAAFFYGSQFVTQKFCPGFDPKLYNASMCLGALLAAAGAFSFLEFAGIDNQGEIALGGVLSVLIAGGLWTLGNRSLLVSIQMAGIGRSFTVLNLISVVSFVGGALFLSELSSLTTQAVLLAIGAVALVFAGSMLITLTGGKGQVADNIRRGLSFGVLASVVIGISNVFVVFGASHLSLPYPFTLLLFSTGACITMLPLTFGKRASLAAWRNAPGRWHALAVTSGLIWGIGAVFGVYTMKHMGASMAVPILQGVMTLVSAVWGIAVFRELQEAGSGRLRPLLFKFIAGSILTVGGVILLAQL